MNSFFCAAFLTQGIIPAYAQSLTPDPNSNTPSVLEAPNGVPVVNIVTPTSSGLSHNKFLDFNVGKDGLILNNSIQMSPSDLGGIIEQNPNLKNGAASLILNEVTSSNRSLLQGPTEVHGQAASYILVNPNGMTCNGCGFINIPKATLSTGVPHVENGILKEIIVDQGSVTIGPNGLSAQETDYFDIVARSIEINGQINAGDYLGLFAGRNTYDPATGKITARTDDGSDKPEFGIDSSALGGMYAGKITLVGTEDGVGVRAPDSVVAASGGFTLDASGKISLGSVNSAGPTRVVSKKNVEVRNSSVVYVADTVELKAGGDLVLSPETVIAAAGDIALSARNILANGRDIAAGIDREGEALEATGKLTLTARQDLQLGANTVLRAGKNTSLQAKTINQQGRVSAEGKATITAESYSVSGAHGKLNAGSVLINAADAVVLGEETQGLLSKSDLGITGGQVSLLADVFAKDTVTLNSKGTLVVGKALETDGNVIAKADDARLLEQASVLAKGTLDLSSAAALSISGTLESAGAMSLKSGALTISSGARVLAKGNLISTASSVQNAGLLASLSDLTLTSDGDVRLEDGGYVRSSGSGTFTIGGDLSVGAKALHRTTTLYSGKALDLNINGALILTDERAGISSAKSLEIDAARIDVVGQILSADTLKLTLTNAGTSNLKATSRLASNNTLTVRGLSQDTHLINSGELYGQQGIDVRLTGTLTNNTSTARIRSGETLRLVAQTIENTGTLQANDELKVEASNGGITQTSSGQMVSLAGSIDLDSAGHTQLAGVTQAATSLSLDGQVGLTVTGSLAAKKGAATIRVGDAFALTNGSAISASDLLDVQADSIDSDGTLSGAAATIQSLTGDIFLGSTGAIQAEQADLTITSAGNFDHQGKVISFGKLMVDADGSYRQHGDLAQTKAKAALDISAADISLAGEVTGLDSVTITAGEGNLNVFAGAELFASKDMSLTAARTLNIAANTSLSSIEVMQLEGASLVTSGEIQANDAISITTREGGLIHSGTIKANLNGEVGLTGEYGLKLSLQGDLVNTGTLTSGSTLFAAFDNYSGTGSLNSLTDMELEAKGDVTVGSGGEILSKRALDLKASGLSVSGLLESSGDMILDTGAMTISNNAQVLSGGNFTGTVASVQSAGILASLSNFTLTSSGSITLQGGSYLKSSGTGLIKVGGDLVVGASSPEHIATLYGAGALSITADGTVHLSDETASIATPDTLVLNAGGLDNDGQILSNGNLDLTLTKAGTSSLGRSGKIASNDGTLTLHGLSAGTHLENAGQIYGEQDLDLRLNGKLENSGAASLIRSKAKLNINADEIVTAGTLQAQDELIVEAKSGAFIQSSSGQMVSLASFVDIDAADSLQLGGITEAASYLALDARKDLTVSGSVASLDGGTVIRASQVFTQAQGSVISTTKQMDVEAASLEVGGTLSGATTTVQSLSGNIAIGSAGIIQSKQGDLTLSSAGAIDHQGKIISLGQLSINAAQAYTQRGDLAQTSARAALNISAASVSIAGEVTGLENVSLSAGDGALNILKGAELYSAGDMNFVAAQALNIADSTQLSSAKSISLEAARLASSGLMETNDTISITAHEGGLTNSGIVKANLLGKDERSGKYGLKLSLKGDLVNTGTLYSGSSVFAEFDSYSGNGSLNSIADMELKTAGAMTIGSGGQVIAEGDLDLKTAGLNVAGLLESTGDMLLNAGTLTISDNARVLSDGDFTGTFSSVDNAGTLASLSDLALTTTGNVTLQDGSYLQTLGAGTLSVSKDLSIGKQVAGRIATLYGASELSITADATVHMSDATASIATPDTLVLKAGELDTNGEILSNGNLDLTLTKAGTSSLGASGKIASNYGKLTLRGLSASTHLENAGQIYGEQGLDLRLSGKLNNSGAMSLVRSDTNLNIIAGEIANTGVLQAQSELNVEAKTGAFTQASSGQMVSFASFVDIESTGRVQLDGITQAATYLALDAGEDLILSGSVATQSGDAIINASGNLIQSTGSVVSVSDLLDMSAASIEANGTLSGDTTAFESLSGDLTIGSAGIIQSKQGDLTLTSAGDVDHQGIMISLGALTLDAAGSFILHGDRAQTKAQKTLGISANTMSLDGELKGLQGVAITARSGDLNLVADVDLKSGRDLRLSAAQDLTVAGALFSEGQMLLEASRKLEVKTAGTITSLATLELDGDNLSNAGALEANGTITLTARAGGLTNSGRVKANLAGKDSRTGEYGLKLALQGDLINTGSLYSGSSLFAEFDDYSGAGSLISIADMSLDADGAVVIATGGQVLSQGSLDLTTDLLSVSGSLESAKDMILEGETLTINSGGKIASDQLVSATLTKDVSVKSAAEIYADTLTLNARSLSNTGKISAGSALSLRASNTLTNGPTAKILSNGTVSLQAKTLNNDGTINSSSSTTVTLRNTADASLTNAASARLESLGKLTISGRSVVNNGLFSGGTGFTFTTNGDVTIDKNAVWQSRSGTLSLKADNIHNEGALVSGQDLELRSTTLDNDGGLILANRNLTIEGQSVGTRSTQLLNHNGGGIESLEGDITLRTQDLQNLTQVTKTLKTYEYANNFATGEWAPTWIYDNRSFYQESGATAGKSISSMWDWGEGETGYIFAPDIVQIEKILELEGASPDEWNPDWWKKYAPKNVSEFDPSKDHMERWSIMTPDEAQRVPGGAQLTVYLEQEEISSSEPTARIKSGKNLYVDVGHLRNAQSQIFATNDLSITGGSLENIGISLSRTYGVQLSYELTTKQRGFGWLGQMHDVSQKTIETSTVAAAPSIIHAGGTLSGNLSGTLTNASVDKTDSSDLNLEEASEINTGSGAQGFTQHGGLGPETAGAVGTEEVNSDEASKNADGFKFANSGEQPETQGVTEQGQLNANGQVDAEKADADEALQNSGSYTLANNTQILQTNAGDLTKGDSLNGSTISAPTPLIPGLGSIDDLEFGDLDLDDPDTLNPRETSGQDFLRTLGLTTNPQLFAPAQEDKTYLIETRFEFVDQTSFFGLPYFAEKLGIQSLDHYGQSLAGSIEVQTSATNVRSLGDAYFDTRLITDQIIAATGDRWISDGVGSDADQVRELMHNAAEAAEDLDLGYGISLSADQVAQLTQDIVWYEKTVVAGHEVLVPRLYLADAKNRRNIDGAIIVAGSVNLSAGEVINTRGKISGKKDVLIAAQGTLTNSSGTISGETVELAANEIVVETLTTTTGNGQDRVGTIVREIGSVSAENSLILKSTGDTLIAGGDLSSGGTLEVGTGGNLKVTGVETKSHFDSDTKGNGVHSIRVEDKTRYVTSSIQVADDLKLKSEKDITLEGALIASDGTASIEANGDVNISALEESTYSFSNSKHKGFLSGKTRRRETSSTEQVGTVVATVDDLDIKSNSGSVDITASAISSEADVTVEAAKDVNLNTAENTFQEDVLKKSHGFFAEVGGGTATVGYKSEKHKFNTDVTTNVVSSVSGENITIKAGEDVNSTAAVLNAGNDLSVTAGGDINLEAVNDNYEHSESHRVDTVALSVSVFENVSGAVKTLVETPKAATAGKGNVGYQAITAVSAGLKAAEAANTLVDIAQNGGTVAGITNSLTVSSEKSRSHEESSAAKVSVLNAGNDLTLIAGEDITSEGAQIDVGGDATLDAGGEITLEAADNTMASSGKNSSKSAGISVTAGISRKGDISVSAGVNASIQNGKHESEQTYKTNSKLNVAGNLDLTSGADTTLKGAQVTAKTADLDVGGDLHIESIQDTGSNSSSSAGASGGISVDIFTGDVSGNLSVNGSKGKGSRAWVTEQTGIVTEETLEIDVAGNTDLTGGLIASDTDDLTLSTGTLTFSDIDDHDKQSNIGGSIGVNFTVPGPKDTDKKPDTKSDDQPAEDTSDKADSQETEAETSYGGQFEGSYANRDKRQITRATIGEGEIIIRDEDKQKELEDSGETESVDKLNRDVDLAQEVTKDVEEYVGVYVSDTAVKAIADVTKTLAEVMSSLIRSDKEMTPEVKEAVDDIITDIADGKVSLDEVRACANQQSFNIFNYFITPAYASGVCKRYMSEAIDICIDFVDDFRARVLDQAADAISYFQERLEQDPQGFEDFLKVYSIFPTSWATLPLEEEFERLITENPDDWDAITQGVTDFYERQTSEFTPEAKAAAGLATAVIIAKVVPSKYRKKTLSSLQGSMWKVQGFNSKQIAIARSRKLSPKYIKKNGEVDWPVNDGFAGTPINTTLTPGAKIDRYGGTDGYYLSPQGTPFDQRAMAFGQENKDYLYYYIVKKPLPVKAGEIAPAFGYPGGGTQFKVDSQIADLIEDGYLAGPFK
ncbi:hemagglutinin repeat-containing protein [Pseudovibrio sp. POLY-S9]|uniref:two-partner secretion domain-containing protein n=1 Tax=Pseudovibrio sp. POLY-S9 TaxID=1576596 RepID=UPI0013795344|nr:hemagglutinin repeat-containing protein [Pseudovibrio sp. POLY-S9]